MYKLRNSIKNYLFLKYAKSKLSTSNEKLSKSIPWIQRQGLMKTINTHCNVLISALLNKEGRQSLSQNKFIFDSMLKYTLGKSEDMLKHNRKTKDIKSYMQLNSYIVYDEIMKGLNTNKNKKAINFNIEKQLSEIQEKMDTKISLEDIIKEKITA